MRRRGSRNTCCIKSEYISGTKHIGLLVNFLFSNKKPNFRYYHYGARSVNLNFQYYIYVIEYCLESYPFKIKFFLSHLLVVFI